MMDGTGKSDSSVVPQKFPNKAGVPAAEGMEGRGLAKGNPREQNAPRTQGRNRAPSALERVRQKAKEDRKFRFTTLFHHVYDVDRLREAYYAVKRDAAPGIDGQTWEHYGEHLEENLQDLSDRLRRGAYRARPVRRAYIPKADGRRRPIGLPTVEDKIVQRSVVEVLNAVYEQDFLGFSYGFRPGRRQHVALDALSVGITTKKVNWVLDADLRAFFDTLGHCWLVKFLEHRIADRRVVRLIQKWLRAGVLEDGKRTRSEVGTVQGGSVSPLLANLYLHYVLDLWAHWWRKKQARGDVIIVRWADDAQEVAGEAPRGEAGAAPPHARPGTRPGGLPRVGRGRAHPVLRSAPQRPGDQCLPAGGDQALAQDARAPQPQAPLDPGTHATTCDQVATARANLPPLSLAAFWRSNLRQEPDAVVPHVRI